MFSAIIHHEYFVNTYGYQAYSLIERRFEKRKQCAVLSRYVKHIIFHILYVCVCLCCICVCVGECVSVSVSLCVSVCVTSVCGVPSRVNIFVESTWQLTRSIRLPGSLPEIRIMSLT